MTFALLWNTNDDILKNVVGHQAVSGRTDFHSIFCPYSKSQYRFQNYLVDNILQNIFFYAPPKKGMKE